MRMDVKNHGPEIRKETIRQEIVSLLLDDTLSAQDISVEVDISEKEVYEHLYHIHRTMNRGDSKMRVIPSECRACGFVFRKRDRLNKPGKCPVCRSRLISVPLFRIEKR